MLIYYARSFHQKQKLKLRAEQEKQNKIQLTTARLSQYSHLLFNSTQKSPTPGRSQMQTSLTAEVLLDFLNHSTEIFPSSTNVELTEIFNFLFIDVTLFQKRYALQARIKLYQRLFEKEGESSSLINHKFLHFEAYESSLDSFDYAVTTYSLLTEFW